jgi:hypothetical protein
MDQSMRHENVSKSADAELPVVDAHTPDFIFPSVDVLRLLSYDLQLPAIDYRQGAANQHLDGNEHDQTEGLDVVRTTDSSAVCPGLTDAEVESLPSMFWFVRQPLRQDPTLPVVVQQFELEVRMTERPGDLASGAIEMMHAGCDYQERENMPYAQSFQDQSGMHTSRRRHMDLLQHGLDEVG